MSNIRRVTLAFNLDDEDEKRTYEMLASFGYRNKAKGLARMLSSEIQTRSQADIIAERLIERLKEENLVGLSATAFAVPPASSIGNDGQPVKRKRGRPRKNPVVYNHTVDTPIAPAAAPKPATTAAPAIETDIKAEDYLPDDDMLASMQAFIGM